MIDADIYVAPRSLYSREVLTGEDVACFSLLRDGEPVSYSGSADGILQIPDDYYIFIECRLKMALEGHSVSVSVHFNDETYYFARAGSLEDGTVIWEPVWGSNAKHRGRPFYNLAGRHELMFSVMYDDTEYEFSVLAEFLASKNSAAEIRAMLETINNNYDEISSMCLDSNMNSRSSLLGLIDQSEAIVDELAGLWQPLIKNLRRILEPEITITPNGIPNSPEAIHWLCENPRALSYCQPEELDFVLHGFPVRTDYAAEEVVVPKYDLYENKVILGFFEHIQTRMSDVLSFITKNKQQGIRTSSAYPGYIRYADIVREFGFDQLKKQENRILKLQDRLYLLYSNFRKITGIRAGVRPAMPKITPFVARNRIYLHLFTLIKEWYESSRQELTLNDFAMHFIKLDKLFEFKVLTTLVGVINELGGSSQKMEWHDMSDNPAVQEQPFGGVPGERPDEEPFNYYRWVGPEGEFILDLWYVPRIHMVEKTCDGDLAVVENFYNNPNYTLTPDFVFRVTWKDNPLIQDWLIMDAKYSSDETVRKESLPSLRSKYMVSLNQKRGVPFYNPVQAVWALYSRGANDQVSVYARANHLGGEYPALPSLCGIRLGRNESDRDVFRNMFCELLNTLKKMHGAFAALGGGSKGAAQS